MRDLLKQEKLDAILLVQEKGMFNHLIREITGTENNHITRPVFLLITRDEDPILLCSRVEASQFNVKDLSTQCFTTWKEKNKILEQITKGISRLGIVFNEVSHLQWNELSSLLRNIKFVDATGFVSGILATLTKEQQRSHEIAAKKQNQIIKNTFNFIKTQKRISEWDVVEFIQEAWKQEGLISPDIPVVAFGPHSGDPHFLPSKSNSKVLEKGDVILIDFWSKLNKPDAVFADMTLIGFRGEHVSTKIKYAWNLVIKARNAAIDKLKQAFKQGSKLRGFELDDAARNIFKHAGVQEFFIHRTGHNITTELHGPGTNLDDFETRDTRQIIPNTCFSIEPGLYFSDFGLRSEVNVLIDGRGKPQIFTLVQDKIILV